MPGRPYGQGNVTMVGDCAQPMTPNLGQGGCVALEARRLPVLLCFCCVPSHRRFVSSKNMHERWDVQG